MSVVLSREEIIALLAAGADTLDTFQGAVVDAIERLTIANRDDTVDEERTGI